MSCGLAELAVTETEQAETPAPVAESVQLVGAMVSLVTEEEKETEPVGEVVTPGEVAETVAVTVTGWPTTIVPLEEVAAVDVEPVVTVRDAVLDDVLCVVLPEYAPVMVSVPADGAVTVTVQADRLAPVGARVQVPPVAPPSP